MSEGERLQTVHLNDNLPVAFADDDTIKILLASDNHIGYMERDPIRGRDAITTFEEILKLAIKHDVSWYCSMVLIPTHRLTYKSRLT